MSSLSTNVLVAISHWFQHNKTQNQSLDMNIVPLTFLMYKTLDTLYLETRNKLPLKPTRTLNKKPHNEPDRITLHLWLTDDDYTALRSILALVGDLIYTSERLKEFTKQTTLDRYISNIFNESDTKFRDARNFFSHMDDQLGNRQKHGISGPLTIGCGVPFTAKATNNVYLIWENNTLYFSRFRRDCEAVIDRPEFTEIFNQARELYAEIHNNPTSKQYNMIDPSQIYP